MNRIHFVLLVAVALGLSGMRTHCQPFSFRKINSSTKADIKTLLRSYDDNVYFLTEKIYSLNSNEWSKMNVPAEGKITGFFPVSSKDIWYSVDKLTNTSILYHYDDGKTKNIEPPFSNTITSIYFLSGSTGIFASFSDIALFENGTFRVLPPLPSRNGIMRFYARDLSSFWAYTLKRELFLFERGVYKKHFVGITIVDFFFTDIDKGYLLSEETLYSINGAELNPIIKSNDFRQISKIYQLNDQTLMMVGKNGLILYYANGKLIRQNISNAGNLSDILTTSHENIWVCGDNGLLLYSGSQNFAEYFKNNQGFSSHKLIYFGISIDDEYGVALADFNGDNKTDIYSVRIYEQNRLYINNLIKPNLISGTHGFSEEAVQRNATGIIDPRNNKAQNELKLGISAADIDNDNDQDIYLCYLNSTNKLLLNKGDGHFRNVSAQKNRACENMSRSNAAAFADVDIDGDLDLFVTNEEGSNRLFENNGTGSFTDITKSSGLGSASGGMCASFADVNNDGYPDLCVSFWYPSNKLYINDSKQGQIRFRDITHLTDIDKDVPAKSNAVAFADVNNDGFTDLFIANRNRTSKLYINDGNGIFKDRTEIFFDTVNNLSNGAVFADFDLDGFQDLYITNVGENVLYKNINGKYFKDVTALFGAELSGYCTGCATGDVDNDGDPDLYVANYIYGDSKLFLNSTETKSFVKLKLNGVRSNKDAVGAKVWLYKTDSSKQKPFLAGYRELSGGGGYGSVSAKEMIFGVEPGAVYFALVKFPSSPDTVRVEQIIAGKTLNIYESDGLQAFNTEMGNNLMRFFTDRELQPEIIKSFFIILLLFVYNLQLRKNIRNIDITRWLASGVILLVFILINQLFLFQWPSAAFFTAPLVALGLLVILHLFIARILLSRLAQKEKLDLREKLSRDLHDDLASTLGSISIYAETLKGMNEPSKSDFKKLSVKIAGLTQSALQSISDIIWMTSPRNDSLQSLISKTSNYLLEILTDNKINFSSVIDIPDDPVILPEKIRNDAFLIIKEGLHNIIRHSEARNVVFTAGLKENFCSISLKDDGIGITDLNMKGRGSHGNGLVNMSRRSEESGIDFEILSEKSRGTEIILLFVI
jgi:signal transduction histidine kinase